jgi:hypothetical protein
VLYLTNAPSRDYYEGSVLSVVEETHKSWKDTLWENGKYHAIASSIMPNNDSDAHSLQARSVDARSLNFDIMRGWIKMCNEHRKRGCIQVASALGLKDLKLIDCEQRRIVPGLPSYEYSALSYVWGTNSTSNDDRSVDNRLPTSLPQTIKDALKVTKELGLCYIWIDRYCINQNNDSEKQTQIQQMDLIYQQASITIVAAAGTDPYFGLPGVGTTSRTVQPTSWIGERCLVSILPNPQHIIKASKWMRRAWTYQEGFFSPRRLVFTEQQVYYECRSGMAVETIDKFAASSRYNIFDSATYRDRPWAICSLISAYSGRELSVEADAIRAFEGVFQSFRRKKFPVRQYLGIPIMPSLTAGPKGGVEPAQAAQRSRGEAFAAGLCWRNTAPATRRTMFPTWSWAGWTAPICYPGSECVDGLKLENETRLKVFIENKDGSLSDMDEYSDVSLDQGLPDSSGKFIHVEAWTIPIDIQYMPQGTSDWIERFRSETTNVHDVSGYFAVFEDEHQTFQTPLNSLYQTYGNYFATQQSFAPDFDRDDLLGIILGRCEDVSYLDRREGIFVMIVHNEGQYFERVGYMEIKLGRLRSLPDIDWYYEKQKSPLELCFRLKERRTIRLG